jgi:hypothetical protein
VTYSITLAGTQPMLMHNVQLGDPDNEYVRDIGRLNALKSKITDEQRAERDWLKFRGGLYYSDTDGPILPAANAFRSLQQAASLTRNGKDVERGLVMLDEYAPLKYDGPRKPDEMWGGGKSKFVDRRMARVNRAPVVAIRPRFDEWSASFRFDLDDEVMNPDDFAFIAEKAGRLIRIGDYRKFFGGYTVAITEEN